jgi:uroporphyrin-III C-methyltransferase
MQLEVEIAGRPVVVVGTAAAAHRAIRRYVAAGAEVLALVIGPPPSAPLPDVRYVSGPEASDLPAWAAAVGRPTLVALVDGAGEVAPAVRDLCRRTHAVLVREQAATQGGVVSLVGGGPGVARLLTQAALEVLRDADVVFYDRLAPRDELADLAPGAELIDVGKRPFHHPVSQTSIHQQIVERARQGQSVVRLKGGDPYVFGRGGEEVLACAAAGVPVRVVPGVSSAIAVPGAAGIPVTHREVSHAFTVISGHVPPTAEELEALARLGGTIVILMGIQNLQQITIGLIRAGLDPATPAAVIERGFSETQRTTFADLGGLAEEVRRWDVQSPAVVVIGEVVRQAHGGAPVLAAGRVGSPLVSLPPLLADIGLA